MREESEKIWLVNMNWKRLSDESFKVFQIELLYCSILLFQLMDKIWLTDLRTTKVI